MTTTTPRRRCLFQPPTNTVVSPPHPFQPPSARIDHPPTRFGPVSTTQPPFGPPPTHIDHHLPISTTYTHCPHRFDDLPTCFGHLPPLLKTYALGMKKVTGTSITWITFIIMTPSHPGAFEIHWKTLSKEEQKKYTEWSKQQKEELGDLAQD
ncbi:hypothetical protein BYT27DRAFT_7247839 [Phlegmacium glaucopus]|nr:hypothetical protein BYT27DRAFT_7247839 [Phlegmacium glaucopus]